MKYSKWSRADWDSVIQQKFHLSRNTLYFSGQSMAFEPEVDFVFNDTSFYLYNFVKSQSINLTGQHLSLLLNSNEIPEFIHNKCVAVWHSCKMSFQLSQLDYTGFLSQLKFAYLQTASSTLSSEAILDQKKYGKHLENTETHRNTETP